MAFALLCSAKKGISALQLQRELDIGSYRTAWHLDHRIRHAMTKEPLAGLLKGTIEVDETYVGGKPRPEAGAPKAKRGRGTKSDNPKVRFPPKAGLDLVNNHTNRCATDETPPPSVPLPQAPQKPAPWHSASGPSGRRPRTRTHWQPHIEARL
jgi:hypothetical protein